MFKKLKNDKIQSILSVVKDPKLQLELKKILLRVRIEPEKKCWFTREDWSEYSSHRFVYKCLVGNLKVGQEICHKCDRRGCVNPDHLFQGTHSDNMQDARKKNRLPSLRKGHKIGGIGLDRLRRLDNWRKLRRWTGESDGDWNRRRDFFPD